MTLLSHRPTHQRAQSLALSPLAVCCHGDGLLLTIFLVNLPWGLHLSCQTYDTSLQPSSPQHPVSSHLVLYRTILPNLILASV